MDLGCWAGPGGVGDSGGFGGKGAIGVQQDGFGGADAVGHLGSHKLGLGCTGLWGSFGVPGGVAVRSHEIWEAGFCGYKGRLGC